MHVNFVSIQITDYRKLKFVNKKSVNIKGQIYSMNIWHNIIKWRGNINFDTVFKNLNFTLLKDTPL